MKEINGYDERKISLWSENTAPGVKNIRIPHAVIRNGHARYAVMT